ncbi:MAG: helix-turn-helix domain-containing protein [Lachnospiraceae bacterium]|nr:helix-turn-helix domain-containing protein [Lachnospiraceae bacterium]
MDFHKELAFAEKLLQHFRIRLRYITPENPEVFPSSQGVGLQDILNYNFDAANVFQMIDEHCNPNTFYRIRNTLLCQYILFRLPSASAATFVYIGPYTLTPIEKKEILNLAETFKVSPANIDQLEQFYSSIPLIQDENTILTLLYTLGECLWGDADNFSIVDEFLFSDSVPDSFIPLPEQTPEEAQINIQLMEQRYEMEGKLMQAVSSGSVHKAELILSQFSSMQLEMRTDNPIRDYKNYAIILNTLFRKAAEKAAVHPVQIHAISSQYARKIELVTSYASYMNLLKEMVRKYCLLVKNHSLKCYSMLVRKVITDINYDLTADLSLKAEAALLNVNPSYLSTLFKKETGYTLTEYVNRKRIDHAIFLLNSTDMQIQTIATYCGIPDVNYFTKMFKKMIGKTPKEYRQMITAAK